MPRALVVENTAQSSICVTRGSWDNASFSSRIAMSIFSAAGMASISGLYRSSAG